MALSPAETEDMLWKHEAEIALLKMLVAELLGALPQEASAPVLAGLISLAQAMKAQAGKPADLPEEAMASYMDDAAEDVEKLVSARPLSRLKAGDQVSFNPPP